MNKKHPYHEAMENLPFSEDLEAKTIALLKASSAKTAKEEPHMKNKNQSQTTSNTPAKKRFPRAKRFVFGGGALAAAACLLLVVLPLLSDSTLPFFSYVETDRIVDVTMDTSTGTTALAPAPNGDVAQEAPPPFSQDVYGKVAPSSPATASRSTSFFDESADQEVGLVFSDGGLVYVEESSVSLGALPDFDEWNTEEYRYYAENRFLSTLTSPLSTFAADVDTASYAKLRATLLAGDSVPLDSVRIEEMLNYFSYEYAEPKSGEPFGITTEMITCPWNPDTKLLLLGLQAEKIETENIPPQNLVFLVDVSGSMDEPNKLPLVKRSLKLLLEELKPTDTISIVTYASSDQVVLDGVRASDKVTIMEALDEMTAGGGTAGARGIQTAYELAAKHFIKGGSNRVLLATDGDLNIGISDEGSLTRLIEEKRDTGIYLSVLGFGMGNYKDNKLEALADHGNGNYAYIDTIYEARKALVEEIGATFLTVAKDVKLQLDFNPAKLKGYRLIGYENRTMAAEDFSDDTKDGGEVGSGHQVTVLYELVPVDSPMQIDAAQTKYQSSAGTASDEWLTLSLRCKAPDGDTSQLFTYPINGDTLSSSDNLRFAAAVAEVGMLLKDSEFKGTASYAHALEQLRKTGSVNGDVYKEEFQYIVSRLALQSQTNAE